MPKKPVVTIKVELPVMSTASAYKKGLELVEKLSETDASPYRVKGISVVV